MQKTKDWVILSSPKINVNSNAPEGKTATAPLVLLLLIID